MSWRFSARTNELILLAWAAVAIGLCWEPVRWHVEYVQVHHPDLAVLFWVVLMLISAVVPVCYHYLLRKRLVRHEPLLFAAGCLAIAFFYEPAATGVLLAMVASAFAVGRFVIERLHLRFPGPVSELAVATGLGLAAFSWLLFFLGIANAYRSWLFVLLLIAPCFALPRQIRVQWAAIRCINRRWGESEELRHPYGALIVTVLSVVTLCAVLVTLAPTITFDALKFHLPLAQHYASAGGLDILNPEVYSYYPQGVEVLMAVGAGIAGQAGAQMVPVLFFPLLLAMVFVILRECGVGTLGALSGVAFAATVPFLHWAGVNPKNDVAIAFYHLAVFWCYLRWRKDGGVRWIIVGVFFVAASCSVKLTALYGVAALIPLYVYAWWRETNRIRNLAFIVLVFCLFGTVWQARTGLLTGNPVYPQGAANPIAAESIHPSASIAATSTSAGRLARPWLMMFDGFGFASPDNNPIGLALVLFFPLWLLVRGKGTPWVCWVFLAVYFAYWLFLFPVLRFAIAPIGLLIALLGARASTLSMTPTRSLRFAGYAASAFAFLFSVCVIFIYEVNAPQFSYFAGRLDKNEFLEQALLTYPSLEFLRQRAEPDAMIFGVNNCSRQYAPDPEQFACEYADPTSEGATTIGRLLSIRAYRYLVIPADPKFDSFVDGLSVDRMLELAYSDQSYEVYRMTRSPEVERPEEIAPPSR